jgi:3-oxoacyl-[acyl-carrier protein] reductase
MAELSGRVAVVTGGSRGMGRAAAEMFAAAGATVIICARTEADIDRAVEEISGRHGTEAVGLVTNVLDSESVDAAMATIGDRFGCIHMLINNAGQSSQRAAKGVTAQIQVSHAPDDPELPPGRFDSMTDDEFRNAFEQKVLGMIRVSRGALPLLRKAGEAAIVNVVSTKGLQAPVRVVTSGVAWAAALNFSKCLSYELADDGIRVNVLGVDRALTSQTEKSRARWAPDMTMAEFEAWRCVGVPLKRMGTAEEMAEAIYFLATPRAAYITGQCLTIDGGAIRSL